MEKVTLFVSKARKDDDPESDIDLSDGRIDVCLLVQKIFVLCLSPGEGRTKLARVPEVPEQRYH